MKRVLISVSDKTGIVDFAKQLAQFGFEIISTGGTKKTLDEAGIKTVSIDSFTGFPEMLDGRVKTLHPLVHGGLLNVRSNPDHRAQVAAHGIKDIDMVVVNLYPFKETISKPNITLEEAIENIDIGGPSMLRSAAKNYQSVTTITDPADYALVLQELQTNHDTTFATRQRLAAKVFCKTAYYDALIANYLSALTGEDMPETITIGFEKQQDLRYGENPHQKAAFYKDMNSSLSLASATQLQGKELSYNNIQDANAAIQIMAEFQEPVVVGLKHMNPCGVGTGSNVEAAWDNCYAGDPVSIFGGIVATNQTLTKSTAEKMTQVFLEIIIAPAFEPAALEVLAKKKNLRVLALPLTTDKLSKWQHVSVNGGILRQELDHVNVDSSEFKVVTTIQPTAAQEADLRMGQKVVKHVKSNAIVVVKDKQVIGVGAGQMNRIGSAKIALEWCKDKCAGAVLASDAFFPFDDCVKMAHEYGIAAIIQPGGSIKDQDSINCANEKGIAMVFTGVRHFKH